MDLGRGIRNSYRKFCFFIDTFDENGKLIQEDKILKCSWSSTYEAEKLFDLDINGDNVEGRNVQKFDRDAFITTKNISKFRFYK